jgi:hypothetical protein
MAKKENEAVITVRLSKELDFFVDDYARKHGISKNGLLVWLARKLYEREQERLLNHRLKMGRIQEYEIKLQALSQELEPSKNAIKTKAKRQMLTEGSTP